MQKIVIINILAIFTLLSCTTINGFISNIKTKSQQMVKDSGLIIENDSKNIVDTTKYRALGLNEKVKKVPTNITATVRENPRGNIKSLVGYLVDNEDDDFNKIKNIHDWICDNIEYDVQSFFSGEISEAEYENVLRSNKAVCGGYASLFSKMVSTAGFRTFTIAGASKGYGYDAFGNNLYEANHAWNAVKINEAWYLIDTTWDAGYVNKQKFIKRYSTGYLFLKAEGMIYTHFPEKKMWQLLETPITYEDFLLNHDLGGEAFDTIEAHSINIINGDNGLIEITLNKIQNIKLSATLNSAEIRNLNQKVYFQNDADSFSALISTPEVGAYTLTLYSDNKSIGELYFESKKSTDIKFPILYEVFVKNNFSLIEPKNKYLLPNALNKIILQSPIWNNAFMEVNGKQYEMTKDGNFFSFNLNVVGNPEVTIYGNEHGNRYEGAITLFTSK